MPPDPNVTIDLPENLRWHRYGAVEVAIRPDEQGWSEMFARHLPVRPGAHAYDQRTFQHVTVTDTPTGGYWVVADTGERSEDERALDWLFDAAASLLWHAHEVAPDEPEED